MTPDTEGLGIGLTLRTAFSQGHDVIADRGTFEDPNGETDDAKGLLRKETLTATLQCTPSDAVWLIPSI
jgi:hypothetical protein